ncbi:sensor histidine kinase [Amycolatopsis sp. NPDC052450]|uniref:sensor histidine kinase n=1 Tax=Amycolatopsis sp. NPDC052450 TaxID=3363937 RepID=UPI0037C6E2AE
MRRPVFFGGQCHIGGEMSHRYTGCCAVADEIELLRTDYRIRLAQFADKLLANEDVLNECYVQLDYVLADCMETMRLGRVVVNEAKLALASVMGMAAANAEIPLDELTHAWSSMFDSLLEHLWRDPATAHTSDRGLLTVRSLQQSIATRSRISKAWYQTVVIHRLELAQTAERERIARELHDWYGSNLSLALRRLELVELGHPDSAGHLEQLRMVLSDLFKGTRRFAAGLRLESPVNSIRSALQSFVNSLEVEPSSIEIFVKGDERSISGHLRSEMFILLREALRNIIAHADAPSAFVMVEVSPGQIGAVIKDSGHGFAVPDDLGTLGGTGLLSMKERVENLSGKFVLTSAPNRGTRINIWIPIRTELDDHVN